MKDIAKSDYLKAGYFQKPHGVRGEIVLLFSPEYGASLEDVSVLMVEIDGLLVPWFPSSIRFSTETSAFVTLDWVENEVQSRKLCGCSVFIERESFVTEDADFMLHHLTGFTLFDRKLGKIGIIEQVDDYGGNIILTITYNDREILIPFHENLLLRFDEEKREIELNCPEGLI